MIQKSLVHKCVDDILLWNKHWVTCTWVRTLQPFLVQESFLLAGHRLCANFYGIHFLVFYSFTAYLCVSKQCSLFLPVFELYVHRTLCVLLFLIHLVYSDFVKNHPCAVRRKFFHFHHYVQWLWISIPRHMYQSAVAARKLCAQVPTAWAYAFLLDVPPRVKWLGHWGCLSSALPALLDTARYHSKVIVPIYTHSIRLSFSP